MLLNLNGSFRPRKCAFHSSTFSISMKIGEQYRASLTKDSCPFLDSSCCACDVCECESGDDEIDRISGDRIQTITFSVDHLCIGMAGLQPGHHSCRRVYAEKPSRLFKENLVPMTSGSATDIYNRLVFELDPGEQLAE